MAKKPTKKEKRLQIIGREYDYSKYFGHDLIVGISGGQTSVFMAKWIKENLSGVFRNIYYVFNNTGQEDIRTIKFLRKAGEFFDIDIILTEAITNPKHGKGVRCKIVDWNSLSMDGQPFKDMINKHGIPNISAPHCSRELKKYVSTDFARQAGLKNYYTAIGIRTDEVDRISDTYKEEKLLYPLISMFPMTKNQINGYWLKMPFRLELKSYEGNCKTCWKKSLSKLITIAHENPSWFDFFEEMEKKYDNFIPDSKKHNDKIELPIRFFRGNLSVADIKEMAKNITPGELEKDESIMYQGELFDLHVSNGCEESCVPF